MKYPKINTIWKRDDNGHIIDKDYSKEEFKNIKKWYTTEKIDGTNIRVIISFCKSQYQPDKYVVRDLDFLGRTDESKIPKQLLSYLTDTFTDERILDSFKYKETYPNHIIIYGEGYGNKINNGHNKYRKDVSFMCFDILIDGLWLEPETVKVICSKLKIDYVPELGILTTKEIVDKCKSLKLKSKIGLNKNILAEGIVCKTQPLLLFRDGEPLKWKLKLRDYNKK